MKPPGSEKNRPQRRKRSWQSWVRLLVVVAAVRIFLTTTTFPQTFDEGVHILCGLEWLERGTYTIEEQHPPLARVAAAVGPYFNGSTLPSNAYLADMWSSGNEVLYGDGGYKTTLMLARLGILPFFIVCCAFLAVWANRWFGGLGAIVSLLLFTTAPPILAHAGLATTDMAATATIFAAIGSYFLLFERPSAWSAVGAGVFTALALLSKFSSIPFLALSFLVIVSARTFSTPRTEVIDTLRNWQQYVKPALIGLSLCAFIVWGGFHFSFGRVFDAADRPHESLLHIAESLSLQPATLFGLAEVDIYPAGGFIRGVFDAMYHNANGHIAYLMGEVGHHGWWYFFPVVLAIKTPIPFLILGLAGIGLAIVASIQRREWKPIALVGCILSILLFSMTANINLGVRHVLVIYPLLALSAGAIAERARRSRPTAIVVGLLLCWQVAESALNHPDHLAYFNQFAGDHPEDFRVDSDLDWGQDLYRLADATRELKIEQLQVAYFGKAVPQAHGIPGAELLAPGQPTSGWIAISLSNLKLYPGDYGWLEDHEPHSLVGKSIRLYYIPEESK